METNHANAKQENAEVCILILNVGDLKARIEFLLAKWANKNEIYLPP